MFTDTILQFEFIDSTEILFLEYKTVLLKIIEINKSYCSLIITFIIIIYQIFVYLKTEINQRGI